jgi:transcriptional regulator with XRE-family HTH domain
MQSDFSLFRDRLTDACHLRSMTEHQLCRSVGLAGRREVDFELFGLKAIDINRLAQIADRLDVSIDWLLGRIDVMELPKVKAKTKKPA